MSDHSEFQIGKIFNYSRWAIIALLCGLLGWQLGYRHAPSASNYSPVDVRENSADYKYINPLLFSKVNKSIFAEEFKPYVALINNYIDRAKSRGDLQSASVYFRDLNSGHWTGVNEDDKYEPGSMLKVALLVAYLKHAEKDPFFMDKVVEYSGYDATGQYFKPKQSLAKGPHPVSELLDSMIKNSDNVAMNALMKNNYQEYADVYKDFRLPLPPEGQVTDYMSARSYSVIFRALYNSTYLSWNYSEDALKLLSETDFKDGLVAGVPGGTSISHKFGEHTYVDDQGNVIDHELHDCGIVYYSSRPYFLCVMTKGQDFSRLQSFIAGMSKITYDYVDSNQPSK